MGRKGGKGREKGGHTLTSSRKDWAEFYGGGGGEKEREGGERESVWCAFACARACVCVCVSVCVCGARARVCARARSPLGKLRMSAGLYRCFYFANTEMESCVI